MEIIADTREQKVLKFNGHNIIHKKLDEGDYNIEPLIPYIVIDRKSVGDLFGTLTNGHERFKREIYRTQLASKQMYVLIECRAEEFFGSKVKELNYRKFNARKFAGMMNTMQEKYRLHWIWCDGREDMEKKILIIFETWIKGIQDGKDM